MKSLRVRLLGGLQVEGRDPARLGRRQVRALLKVLALGRGRPVGVGTLVDCLWGEHLPSRPADQVSVLASRLRGALGPDRVRHSDAGYALLVDWLDVDALGEYVAEAERRLAEGALVGARAAATAGLSLVRGPLLADEPDPWWAEAERAAVDRLVSRLRHAASAAAAAGDWNSAAELADQSLDQDPYDEVALRGLMGALARSGRPASALAAYARARKRLAEDLGVSPSPPTEELHSAILLGELPAERSGAGAAAAGTEELPGRADAIGELDALLDSAGRGHGQLGLVVGEAGIGKSRLLEVWSRNAAERGARVVAVGCDELGRSLPLQPVLDLVAELVRLAGPAAADDVLGPDRGVLGPLLGTQSGPSPPAQLVALTDPRAGQALLFAAVFSVLRRWAGAGPLLLLVDDAHLADSSTIAWLAEAPRRLVDARVAVVAAGRAEETVPLRGAKTVTLGPLT